MQDIDLTTQTMFAELIEHSLDAGFEQTFNIRHRRYAAVRQVGCFLVYRVGTLR